MARSTFELAGLRRQCLETVLVIGQQQARFDPETGLDASAR
jgi:hypothetical protein